MKENKSMLHEGELQALTNALTSFDLKGYAIHQTYPKKAKYFLTNDKGTSLTGEWDYIRLNHFIMGYGKAKSLTAAAPSLKAENERLREALTDVNNTLKPLINNPVSIGLMDKIEAALK